MRKTKIICTMGPSTDKGDVMEQLVREGMDVARFNFSHGPHDEQRGRIQKLRELRKKYDRPVAALLDTKGPEIRLGGNPLSVIQGIPEGALYDRGRSDGCPA